MNNGHSTNNGRGWRDVLTKTQLPDGGTVVLPGEPDWDTARAAWNLAVDQRPAAVALPRSARDVATLVDSAGRAGLAVAAQSTGHNAAPLGPLGDTMLIKTGRMRQVTIQPETRTARVGGGALWRDVTRPAGEHGLAALAGSSPDVGVAGYTLGGGLSWLSRRYGLAANSVEAVELVTADGRLRRADRDHEPDLFWALRGGGGSFGVVTALELRLFPVDHVYAGVLWWPVEQAPRVLREWHRLVDAGLPDEMTTVGRFLNLPPLPEIPEPVRGKSWFIVEAIHLGDPAGADRLLAPLRALRPVMDTIAPMPTAALGALHMDPEQPVPARGDGLLLDRLDEAAIDALVRLCGAGSGSPLLTVEVRQLGGELGRARPGDGALATVDAGFALYAAGLIAAPEQAAAVQAHVEAVRTALGPWTAPSMYLNFAESDRAPATLWPGDAYQRLRRVKSAVDPGNLIHANHTVPPSPN